MKSKIQYNPTPANGHQLRQWAKDSMRQAEISRGVKTAIDYMLEGAKHRNEPISEAWHITTMRGYYDKWGHHAAPEWETQRFELSLWATLELRNTAWIIESDAKEVAFKLGLI